MPTIVETDPTTAETLAGAAGASTRIDAIDTLKAHLESHPDEFAVILGPSMNLSAAVAFADTYRVMRPALSVIL
ncbi:MAG: hypothetical protein H0V48_08920, partial [Nocardioidaceae bacterium]|nr:hypothetical protein [Nocardioidaceae bacterium]